MTDRIAIGYICEKGDHTAYVGEDLSCGAHYYATIYVTVEKDRRSMRGGEPPTLERIADDISRAMRDSEEHTWCKEEN